MENMNFSLGTEKAEQRKEELLEVLRQIDGMKIRLANMDDTKKQDRA